MKKIISLSFAILLLLALATSCFGGATEKRYNVTFVLGDGREDIVTEVSSSSKLFTPKASDGWIFAGWYLDEELTRPLASAGALRSDTTLYASWLPSSSKTVTYVYGGDLPNAVYSFDGSVVCPEDPIRENYHFCGWYADEAGSVAYDFSAVPDSSVVVYAKWEYCPEPVVTMSFGKKMADRNYTVSWGDRLSSLVPVDVSGYTFGGWYYDSDCRSPVGEDDIATCDVTVYAKWLVVDELVDVGNMVASSVLSSTVSVVTTTTNVYGASKSASGSGVIIKKSGSTHYCITNNHVVDIEDGYPIVSYKVEDCYGTQYNARLVAADAAYDLAILKFTNLDIPLTVAEKEDSSESVGSKIVSVGYPVGMINVVTYGSIIDYDFIASGSPEFRVGCHDSPLNRGSSGGGVFNYDCKLVGINFAAGGEVGDSFTHGFFIPIEKVIEFIENSGI